MRDVLDKETICKELRMLADGIETGRYRITRLSLFERADIDSLRCSELHIDWTTLQVYHRRREA